MKKYISTCLIFFSCLSFLHGQQVIEGQKRWNATDKLSLDDYRIKISDNNSDPIFSQFVISHSINGFDFLKRNLNQRIENRFLGNASWIDTTRVETIDKQIEFQQMQFDLAEIQARKFRKRVLQEKSKIAKRPEFLNQLNDELMTEYSEMRLQLMQETESGRNEEMLVEWKEKIARQLEELEEFSFENENRIKF